MWNYILISCTVLLVSVLYHCYFRKPFSIVEHADLSYDYIIVGAGTSGCVIASRLSERSNVTVLLVEAGGYFGWWSAIPLAAPLLQGSEVDWNYKTESQLFSSKGLRDYKQSLPRGKGLGGSGQMNYLVHSFGKAEDYKNWPRGWSYADLLPYFNRVSNTIKTTLTSTEEYLVKAFAAAEITLGSANLTLQRAASTFSKGVRWSTYHAYLQEAWNRQNLHILMETLAAKVEVEDSRATGVELIYSDGSRAKINVRKDVILCAGAFNTPQLLLLSGIGPEEELKKHKIPIVKHISNIGKNLFDHLNVPMFVNLVAPVSITLRKMQSFREFFNYIVSGTGLWATNAVMGIARSNDSGVILFGMGSTDEKLLRNLANIHTETYRSMFPSYNDSSYEGFLYLAVCLKPKSRGTLTLRSNDIRNPPRIDPAYLQHSDDISCTHRAIKLALRILGTRLFRKYGASVHVPDFEECRHLRQDYRDPDYAECVMRMGGLTSHHPGGTCRMGMDVDSVVDENLRVRGVDSLRIIDASVIPAPLSGTPNSVVISMAERASDIIFKDSLSDLH